MTNVEKLALKFAKLPHISETGPQDGAMNGKLTTRLGMRSRCIHAVLCVLGLTPFVLHLCGVPVKLWLIAVGFGLIVPGGGFMACGNPVTMAIGLFICFYLWRVRGQRIQDFLGSCAGIVGFWALGAIGGLLCIAEGRWLNLLPPYWGYALAVVSAIVLFGRYELRVHKMYRELRAARDERLKIYDDAVTDLEQATSSYTAVEQDELDDEQLAAVKFLLDACVNREEGDLSGFERMIGLAEYRYQLSAFGYALMLYHAKYAPNFTGYLKDGHRFLIRHYGDPRTCDYWAKQMKVGYFKNDPDPIAYANVMLSGWQLPVIAGYHDQYGDDEFEKEASIRYHADPKNPGRTFDYNAKGCVEVLYNQFKNRVHPMMLIPCEPHVAFPTCNSFGLLGMLIYDRDHNTHYCEDFWDSLYDAVSSDFIEIDGSMALRRQDQYGLRHLPASQIGYNPMADVQNYLHFLPVFPGLARRCYALVRKSGLELRDGAVFVRNLPWEKMTDMFTFRPNPAVQIAALAMTAAEFGDQEMITALRETEQRYMARSKTPSGVSSAPEFKFKDVNSLTVAYMAFSRLCKQGYWEDVILRGMPETSAAGPLLCKCSFPDVMVAAAHSNGNDLKLVLCGTGEQELGLERLKPNMRYTLNGANEFSADEKGCAEITVQIDGRTEFNICCAV
jgi:hypothetical protein